MTTPTPEQMRVIIAEFCGIKPKTECPDCFGTGFTGSESDHWRCETCRATGFVAPRFDSPDYCNDLNAMWEAEEKLLQSVTLDQWQDYVQRLVEVCGCAMRPAYVVTALDHVSFSIHATALQRARAFVKTIQGVG